MKKFLAILVLSLLWCNNGFAEMYACSLDLKRFGRPGEIETKVYTRKGNSFINNLGWKFVIDDETRDLIFLRNLTGISYFIVIINKKTKEFTEGYLGLEDSKNNEVHINTYGKCVLG
tara:strand:+ start:267 stop:617 length:351 start_codon:yes stop_codon:yes gene_type:complete